MASLIFKAKLILGITRSTVLLYLPTLHFPRSFAIDLMHSYQYCSHLVGYLVRRTLQERRYQEGLLWQLIQDSRSNIPAVIGTMPRSCRWRHRWKAVEWRMFLEQFGTTLTNGHLPKKEHRNFCDLRQIWVSAIQHSINTNDIAGLDQTARKFIKEYEQLYYHDDPE